MESFRAFLTSKGCPGSSRDLTKVLVWLQAEDVSCPEDLKHLRKLSTFSGVDRFQCDIIAFIDALIGKGIELGVPECIIVEPESKRARVAVAKYASYILASCVMVMHCLLYQAHAQSQEWCVVGPRFQSGAHCCTFGRIVSIPANADRRCVCTRSVYDHQEHGYEFPQNCIWQKGMVCACSHGGSAWQLPQVTGQFPVWLEVLHELC